MFMVFDLNPQALEELAEFGAKAVSTNAVEFAEKLDSVLVLVVNAQQVNTVLFQDRSCRFIKTKYASHGLSHYFC